MNCIIHCLGSLRCFLFISLLTLPCAQLVFANQSLTVPLSLFVESFGKKGYPAIILNAGAGNPGLTWDDAFCQRLANRGYYVIRYDYRDTGKSPAINFEKNPYTALDLAHDVKKIMNAYKLKTAHMVGFSMGGQIAQVMGAYYPENVNSIILIGASSDFDPGFRALERRPQRKGLSPPAQHYVDWIHAKKNKKTYENLVDNYLHTWRLLDGGTQAFDEAFYRKQAHQVLTGSPIQDGYLRHAKAMKRSYEIHKNSLEKISQPTLILQGGLDPVFPLDHGLDMAKKIKDSHFHLIPGLGHAISPQHFETLVGLIDGFIKSKT